MSLTATYNGDLSRVQLSADALGATATYAVVERSLNEQLWVPVRGGTQLPVESEQAELDDSEFFAADTTHYRIRSFDGDDVQQEEFTAATPPGLLEGRIWWKSPDRHPLLNRPLDGVGVSSYTRPARAGLAAVAGRSLEVDSADLRLGRRYTLTVAADTHQAAGEFDLILAATRRVFLHVPPEINIPGGWFSVGETTDAPMTDVQDSAPRLFSVPLVRTVPPAPQVVGTLLTAETVFRLYGDPNALYAAHSTGRSLLATIGDPNDLVVV